jgi:hypothetical protein
MVRSKSFKNKKNTLRSTNDNFDKELILDNPSNEFQYTCTNIVEQQLSEAINEPFQEFTKNITQNSKSPKNLDYIFITYLLFLRTLFGFKFSFMCIFAYLAIELKSSLNKHLFIIMLSWIIFGFYNMIFNMTIFIIFYSYEQLIDLAKNAHNNVMAQDNINKYAKIYQKVFSRIGNIYDFVMANIIMFYNHQYIIKIVNVLRQINKSINEQIMDPERRCASFRSS